MNKNRFTPVAAALAAAAMTLAACGTTGGDPLAAPRSSIPASPSSTAPSNAADAADADRAARARAGLPNSGGLTLEDAETAARRGLPVVFGAGGRDCAWVRLPDGSLWALHSTLTRTGSATLARDLGTEAAWRADPDFEPGRCTPAEGIPTADDPAQPEPYRWVGAYDTVFLRWHGKTFIIPGTVSVGLALKAIASEIIPGVDGVQAPN